MEAFYVLIVFATFVVLIVGLINPSLIMRWSNKPSRLKVIGWWFLVNILLLILLMFISPTPTSSELIESAKKKIEKENYSSALSDLRQIGKSDSLYTEAQTLIIKLDSLLIIQKEEQKRKETQLNESLNSQTDSLKSALKNRALTEKSKFNVQYDEFEGITWLYPKSMPYNRNSMAFYTYIGLRDNGQFWRRWIIRYHGDEWLFLRSIIIKTDNNTYTFNASNAKRDNNTDVWEWIDIPVQGSEDYVLYDIIHSNQTKIRFRGQQYHYDWNLSSDVIRGLKEINDYYYLLDSISKIN